ncbi:MAG: VCBS repeat-containing protein [candidate division WOR-3 bacterium]|nr:MAG: VCBS repeat-containing protein [candidate division WOR-3 bacterium]
MNRISVCTIPAVIMVICAACSLGRADVQFSPSPVWTAGTGYIPTGIGCADIDTDGWIDLVIANGCDAAFVPNHVYFNSGGTLPSSPDWVSQDQFPSDNVAIGDLDNDGDYDLVVAQLGYSPAGCPPLPQLIYYNDNGLSQLPGWQSQPANSFSCAIGDPDKDGDLDIAFAQGDYATSQPQKTVMYENIDGLFDTIPAWETDSLYFGVEAVFCDIDCDDDLDLVLGARTGGIAVFYNDNGTLETTPSWQTLDIIGGRQFDFGDINEDGYPDLAVAGMAQGFFLFRNYGGTFETTPSWSCYAYSEPSCVAWADADDDGDLDLAAGGWFAPVGIFQNTDGELSDTFMWKYTGNGFKQQVAWADFDQDGIIEDSDTFVGNDVTQLYYISNAPMHSLISITINGIALEPGDYCYDITDGWFSLAAPPPDGDILCITYEYSSDLDLVSTGTSVMLFENQVTGILEQNNNTTPQQNTYTQVITGPLILPDHRSYIVYDVSGRRTVPGMLSSGTYFVEYEGRITSKVIKIQ